MTDDLAKHVFSTVHAAGRDDEARRLRAALAAERSEHAQTRAVLTGQAEKAIEDVTTLREAANEALAIIDAPYPIAIFPDLQQRDEVFAAMRAVNSYATEQFWAECARQRAAMAREVFDKALGLVRPAPETT